MVAGAGVNVLLEWLLVGAAVLASAIYVFKALAPYGWRVALARRLAGRLPDRVCIWLAGASACEACGSRLRPGPPSRH
jgi:hypothetical protein